MESRWERGHREPSGGKGAQGQRKERKWGNPGVRSHSSASQGNLSQEGCPDGLSTLCRGTGAPGSGGPCPRGAYKLRRETEPVLKCGKSMEKDWPRIVRDPQKEQVPFERGGRVYIRPQQSWQGGGKALPGA